MDKIDRIERDEMYMQIALVVSQRSTCLSRHVGAVLIKDGHIISTGYNGAPKGVKNCFEKGMCIRKSKESGKKLEYCMAAHAESNAIAQAAYQGIKTEGATLYCMYSPCSFCAKIIINAGIKEFVYIEEYTDLLGMDMLKETKIILRKIKHPKIYIDILDIDKKILKEIRDKFGLYKDE